MNVVLLSYATQLSLNSTRKTKALIKIHSIRPIVWKQNITVDTKTYVCMCATLIDYVCLQQNFSKHIYICSMSRMAAEWWRFTGFGWFYLFATVHSLDVVEIVVLQLLSFQLKRIRDQAGFRSPRVWAEANFYWDLKALQLDYKKKKKKNMNMSGKKETVEENSTERPSRENVHTQCL